MSIKQGNDINEDKAIDALTDLLINYLKKKSIIVEEVNTND